MDLDIERLVKLLNLSTSDFEGEALSAISKANQMVRNAKLTWDELLLKRQPSTTTTPDWKREQDRYRRWFEGQQLGALVEVMFEKLLPLKLKAHDFLLSLQAQYERKGFLSQKQMNSLIEIYELFFPEEDKK